MEIRQSVLRRRLAGGLAVAGALFLAGGLQGSASAAERGYELVSPLGSLAQIDGQGGFSMPDGETVFFSSGDALAGSIPNGPFPTSDSFMARRGPAGWTTQWVTDLAQDEPGTIGSRTQFVNADGSKQIIATENRVDPGDTMEHSVDGYLRTLGQNGPEFSWLTPGPRTGIDHRSVQWASDDLSVLIVTTQAAMVDEDVNDASDAYILRDGQPELIAQTTTGTALFGSAPGGYTPLAAPNAVVGDLLFFQTSDALAAADTDALADIYRRNPDGTFTLFSPNRRTTPLGISRAPDGPPAFSADGDIACFRSREPLLDTHTVASQQHVYCFTASTDTLEQVTIGSTDTALRLIALSDDGSTVFFITRTALLPEDDDTRSSLYARDRDTGQFHYLGEIGVDDTERGRIDSTDPQGRAIHIAPDGSEAFFVTNAALTAEDVDSDADIYRWTVDGGVELLTTALGAGDSTFGSTATESDPFTYGAIEGRITTDDWGTFYFNSQVPHSPADGDSGYSDVYQWSEEGGFELLSPAGDAPYDAFYLDSSADGSSVFFVTAEPIDPRDVNAARDLYVSRVGGGFAIEPPVQPCRGDACQGPPVKAPELPVPGSPTFTGGDQSEEPEGSFPKHSLLKLKPAQRRALARSGRTTLQVRVSGPGAVTVRAFAKIGRRRTRVAVGRSGAGKASTVRVPLALSRRARTTLRAKRSLRVTILVDYSETDRQARQVVVLRG